MDIQNYMNDGANYQAQAVLAFVRRQNDTILNYSWNDEFKSYEDRLNVGRWENCREQGYVISMNTRNGNQLNIAFLNTVTLILFMLLCGNK